MSMLFQSNCAHLCTTSPAKMRPLRFAALLDSVLFTFEWVGGWGLRDEGMRTVDQSGSTQLEHYAFWVEG